MTRTPRNKKSGLLALLLLIGTAVVFLATIFGGAIAHQLRYRKFDADAWRNGNTPNADVRVWMAADLVKSKRLDGLKRESVTNLLGPADPVTNHPSWDLIYLLGLERSLFRMESECLGIRFDDKGRVSGVKIFNY